VFKLDFNGKKIKKQPQATPGKKQESEKKETKKE